VLLAFTLFINAPLLIFASNEDLLLQLKSNIFVISKMNSWFLYVVPIFNLKESILYHVMLAVLSTLLNTRFTKVPFSTPSDFQIQFFQNLHILRV